MANHYKCKKCNSKDIEVKQAIKFGASSTIPFGKDGKLDFTEPSFETSQEPGSLFLYCKKCFNGGEHGFELLRDD